MKVDKEVMKKIETNARLNLSEEEREKFMAQINDVLDYFDKIKEANTDDVEPSFHPMAIKNVFREDVVEESLTQEEALVNAKHKKDGFFKGPKVV
jgi:aspartyl-tRNA(Asn)/glutamyl-tRNA(Gln) amidotransferase subunit C